VFLEFGVVIAAAVLISAFVSLTLTPMLNAYLMKKDVSKKSKFYNLTEPFFIKLNEGYQSALTNFLKWKKTSFIVLVGCFAVIGYFYSILPKETAPYDDRSMVGIGVTTPEGATYEYTDRLMQDISQLINDSIPEKRIALVITSPGFGTSSVNSGRVRLALVNPEDRERTQSEIADKISGYTKKYTEAKVLINQQPTIAVNRRGGLPVQYIIQAQNFEKLEEKIPEFMNEVSQDPTFSVVDVNLKFNKPEIYVNIDRQILLRKLPVKTLQLA